MRIVPEAPRRSPPRSGTPVAVTSTAPVMPLERHGRRSKVQAVERSADQLRQQDAVGLDVELLVSGKIELLDHDAPHDAGQDRARDELRRDDESGEHHDDDQQHPRPALALALR